MGKSGEEGDAFDSGICEQERVGNTEGTEELKPPEPVGVMSGVGGWGDAVLDSVGCTSKESLEMISLGSWHTLKEAGTCVGKEDWMRDVRAASSRAISRDSVSAT